MRLYLVQHGESQPESASPERGLAPRIAPETLEDINPNDPVAPVAERVRGWTKDTLLAGHLPFVDRMATLLVTGREEPPVVAFQPGSAACLERDAAGLWVIDWMLRPELLAGR